MLVVRMSSNFGMMWRVVVSEDQLTRVGLVVVGIVDFFESSIHIFSYVQLRAVNQAGDDSNETCRLARHEGLHLNVNYQRVMFEEGKQLSESILLFSSSLQDLLKLVSLAF